jgi:hypothetical protein
MVDRLLRISIITSALCLAALSGDVQAQSAISILDYRASVPAGWTTVKPSSSSRLAQFIVDTSDSANRTEVVVFFFGQAQGGNVQANLERWRGQFSNPDGAPVSENVTRDSSGVFPITIAEYHGTYRRGIGAGSADSARTGQALVAAIVETPRGALFVQLFGPAARVASARQGFVQFVKGIK